MLKKIISDIINIILVNIEIIPAFEIEVKDERPKVVIPSLTPKPIGVIIERYPTRSANMKRLIKFNMFLGSRKKIETALKYVASPKKKKVSRATA